MYQTKFLKNYDSNQITILLTSDIHNALNRINSLGEWLSNKKKEYVYKPHSIN